MPKESIFFAKVKILLLIILMIKSIIELTDLIQKYKQEIFWESEKLKKKFNTFYKKQLNENLDKLKDYKNYGYININLFLYNRKLLFSENPISIDNVIRSTFEKYKKIDKEQIRNEFLEYIYEIIYKIVESIVQIDRLFKISPKIDKDIIVYRGLNFENRHMEEKISANLLKLKNGDIYTFPNYLSTSLLNDIVFSRFLNSKFINKKNTKIKCCFFKIIIPKNTRILYMDTNYIQNIRSNISEVICLSVQEYEVLLPRSSILKFIKRDIISGSIPKTCEISDINKGKINNIYIYEFEYITVDKNREKFNLKKMKNPEYVEKLMGDIVNIELYFRKDDLITQLHKKNRFL
jgi:hypothetical protein